MAIQVVILAAGLGKRMHSSLPKVLHHLAGKPLLEHVIATAHMISPELPPIIVYGHQGEILKASLKEISARWVEQKEQLGTGHALLQAITQINPSDRVLVLYGDVPLITEETLNNLITHTPNDAVGMLTAKLANPTGYGRIKRHANGRISHIVEEKDATDQEKAIKEINPGIYLVPASYLQRWLPQLKNNNAQAEYYLTDIIAIANAEKIPVHSTEPNKAEEILGINDKIQLAQLERFYQRQMAEQLMLQGVTVCDPARLDIRGQVQAGRDVFIDVNVILEGNIVLGDGCHIAANCILRDAELGANVIVKANSLIEKAKIADGCEIGPFARLRPGSVLGTEVHIGNFVEIKQSQVKAGTKINHLSYIGDSEIGKNVNIGAGTITCNYDGAAKHKTIIGDNVHIGSDTQLVAPVTIGAGATIGAGSTVTKDAPAQQLTVTHKLDQRSSDWQRPQKK